METLIQVNISQKTTEGGVSVNDFQRDEYIYVWLCTSFATHHAGFFLQNITMQQYLFFALVNLHYAKVIFPNYI